MKLEPTPAANAFAKGRKTYSTVGGVRLGAFRMAATAVVALHAGATMAAARIVLTGRDRERDKVSDGQCQLWDAPSGRAASVIACAGLVAVKRRFGGKYTPEDRMLIGALGPLRSAEAVNRCTSLLEQHWGQVTKVARKLEENLRRHPQGAPPLTYLLTAHKRSAPRDFRGLASTTTATQVRRKNKGRGLVNIEEQPLGDRKAWRFAFHEAGHVVANLMADSVMVESRIFSEGSKSYKRGMRGETIHYYVWNKAGLSQHRAAVSGYAGAIAVHFQNKPIVSDYKLRWLMPLVQADLSHSDWSDIPMDPSASWKAASDCLRLLRKNWMSVELIANALMQEMVRHRPALMPRILFLPVAF